MNDITDSLSRDFHPMHNQFLALFAHTRRLSYHQTDEDNRTTGRDCILDCLAGAAKDQEAGVELVTHTKCTGMWNNWLVFISYSGSSDPCLQELTCAKKHATFVHSSTLSEEDTFLPLGTRSRGRPQERLWNIWQRPSSQVVVKTSL